MAPDNLPELHQILTDRLGQEELRTLSFNLGVDYEDLPPGGKSSKVRELLLYLQRRGRLSELKSAVNKMRPDIVWPASSSTDTVNSSPDHMTTGFRLSREDFDRLVQILAEMPEFRSESARISFLDDVFAGSLRGKNILGRMNLSGTPRGVAIHVINSLSEFGKDDSGQEMVGILINKLLSYIGGGANAEFLRSLLDRYPSL